MLETARSTAKAPIDISMSSSDLLSACQVLGSNNGDVCTRVFEEPPQTCASSDLISSASELLPPTPSIYVRDREEAFSPQLFEMCLQRPIVLVRNLANACNMDLSLYR